MKTLLPIITVFIGCTFASYSFAAVTEIDCPDVQECFKCIVNRVAPNKVKFEFVRSSVPGRRWTPIVMVASTSTPIADTKRATPELDPMSPIQLIKQKSGDYVVICQYSEHSKYGGHVGYTPTTTLTLRANEVKSCVVKDEKLVSCEY